jgi:hypothetical protein
VVSVTRERRIVGRRKITGLGKKNDYLDLGKLGNV